MNTYNTTLQTNNTSLSSILNTINALPDAGGDGGGAVETCDFTLLFVGSAAGYGADVGVTICYSKVSNGKIEFVAQKYFSNGITLNDVLKGSSITLESEDDWNMYGFVESAQGVTLEYSSPYTHSSMRVLFIGESGTYTVS